MPPDVPPEPVAFGLIVIGDEVLNGKRTDRHLVHFKAMLGERGHSLAWHWLLPDDPAVLTDHLRFSLARPQPVFACGGIGATPDDYTRACAAAAAGLPLERHPEAAGLIEGRFGQEAYPNRILMADLPKGCGLVPNPYNRISGFRIGNHFFLPGFPQMAWPMAEQVLALHFPPVAARLQEVAVRVIGVPESRLVPLMRDFAARYPDLKPFSLPHLGEDPHILLGIRGRVGLAAALADLRAQLTAAGLDCEPAGD